MQFGKAVLLAAMLASVSSSVLAQDWIAERLRGGVMQLEHGNWVALERGDIVPDGRKIRTAGDGRVELVRGQERIALAANTEIAVRDAPGQKMTSVVQTLGSVTIEAERRNVQHFSVQTPVLAAVVKGTQFTVTYRNGQARVEVDSGVVQVQDNAHNMVVDVTPGQAAAASQAAPLDVSGPGSEDVVYLIDGEVVPAVAREAVLRGDVAAEDALGAVRNGAILNANARANAGGQGNAVSANARANNNGNGIGNRNGSSGNGNGNSGPPSHSNAGGNGNGPPAHSNAGGNSSGAGNNGNGNGNGPQSQSNAGGNGDGPSEHSNAGGNSSSGSSGSGNGPPEHSNAGGNGKGNGKKDD